MRTLTQAHVMLRVRYPVTRAERTVHYFMFGYLPYRPTARELAELFK